MFPQRIYDKIHAIKNRLYLENKNTFVPSTQFISSISYENLKDSYNTLKETLTNVQLQYDRLLEDSNVLIEEFNDFYNENSTQFEYLQQQYQNYKEKCQAQKQELEGVIKINEDKMSALRQDIFDKFQQNTSLIRLIQTKQTQLQSVNVEIEKLKKEYVQSFKREKEIYDKKEAILITEIQEYKSKQNDLGEEIFSLKENLFNQIKEKQIIAFKFSEMSKYFEEMEKQAQELQNNDNTPNNYTPQEIQQRTHSVQKSLNEECRAFNLGEMLLSNKKKNKILIEDLISKSKSFEEDEENQNKENVCHNQKCQKSIKKCRKSFTSNFIKEFELEQLEFTEPLNPYHAFFTLTVQCVKINSEHFQEVAGYNVAEEWEKLLENRVPMHKWEGHIAQKIKQLYLHKK